MLYVNTQGETEWRARHYQPECRPHNGLYKVEARLRTILSLELLRFLSTDAKIPLAVAMGYAKNLSTAKLTRYFPSLVKYH